jgi:hypothetical protein
MQDYDPDIEFDPGRRRRPARKIDPVQYQHYVDLRRSQQHMPFAVAAGFIGGAVGVAAWFGLITFTKLQVDWMVVIVAATIATLVRTGGKGFDRVFGFAGALLTVLMGAAGFLLSGCWFVAAASENAGFVDVVTAMTPLFIVEVFKAMYDPIDAIFFGIALLIGFRLSYRRISRAEKILVSVEAPVEMDSELDAA